MVTFSRPSARSTATAAATIPVRVSAALAGRSRRLTGVLGPSVMTIGYTNMFVAIKFVTNMFVR
jgi:hypothetical protein